MIREWALENGYELSARGRVRSVIIEAYAAVQEAEKIKKPARSGRRAKKP